MPPDRAEAFDEYLFGWKKPAELAFAFAAASWSFVGRRRFTFLPLLYYFAYLPTTYFPPLLLFTTAYISLFLPSAICKFGCGMDWKKETG